MTCVRCKSGEMKPGTTTVHFGRREMNVLIKSVPADVCDNCGEYFLSESIASKIDRIAAGAFERGAEVEVLRFAA